MSEYADTQRARQIEMRQLGNELKLTRAQIIADHAGYTPGSENYHNAVNRAFVQMQPEIVEARYLPNAPKFSRLFAEATLDFFLDRASRVQSKCEVLAKIRELYR